MQFFTLLKGTLYHTGRAQAKALCGRCRKRENSVTWTIYRSLVFTIYGLEANLDYGSQNRPIHVPNHPEVSG